tara:strand:+ start:383 stop:1063 length:681 start_codon:yes stop_codon:yes gene_type:complete
MGMPRKSFYEKMLNQLKDPTVLQLMKENDGSRIFSDLPNSFNCIFINCATDSKALVSLLNTIHMVSDDAEKGTQFARQADANKVKTWAEVIIRHACKELLTDTHRIKPDLAKLIQNRPDALSARDIICGYVSTVIQNIIVSLSASAENKHLQNNRVFEAFTLFVNDYPKWVNDVLNPHRHLKKAGIAAATGLGIVFFGSLAYAYVSYQDGQNNNNDNNEKRYPDFY